MRFTADFDILLRAKLRLVRATLGRILAIEERIYSLKSLTRLVAIARGGSVVFCITSIARVFATIRHCC